MKNRIFSATLTVACWIAGLLLIQSTRVRAGAADSIRVTVTEGTNMAADLSPDKKLIAMDLQGTIWIVPVGGAWPSP